MKNIINSIKKGIKYYLSQKKKTFVNTYTIDKDKLLKEKVALVTGGSSGIGLEIAKKYSEHSANVIIIGRNEEKLKQIKNEFPNIDYIVSDISEIEEHVKIMHYIKDKYKKIDILVNNAGISLHEKDFLDVTEESYDKQFDTNLKGAYFLTQRIIKEYKKDLNILFITSERGSQCDDIPYGLTKVALNSLIQGLSYRFIRENIRVNGIAPGVTSSNMVKVNPNGNMATSKYISGRYFLPSEVAEVALFLASDCSKCISGEIIHTNDGNHLNSYLNLNDK